jgi:hypothetical protein
LVLEPIVPDDVVQEETVDLLSPVMRETDPAIVATGKEREIYIVIVRVIRIIYVDGHMHDIGVSRPVHPFRVVGRPLLVGVCDHTVVAGKVPRIIIVR